MKRDLTDDKAWNLCAVIPDAGRPPISANQAFVQMRRPRYRDMREVQSVLDGLVACGAVELVIADGPGRFHQYRWPKDSVHD